MLLQSLQCFLLLALSVLQHLQVHAKGLLDGGFGDKAHKVVDIGLPVGQQLVNRGLPHHGLGHLPGVL